MQFLCALGVPDYVQQIHKARRTSGRPWRVYTNRTPYLSALGVPDYVQKMHKAAKTLHEWQQKGNWSSMEERDEQPQAKTDRRGM
jgi:hypothetical protein